VYQGVVYFIDVTVSSLIVLC